MISGTVGDQGAVEVRVALDSVETNIGIRNDRMKKMLFEVGLYPEAVITAQLSEEAMAAVGIEQWGGCAGRATDRFAWSGGE